MTAPPIPASTPRPEVGRCSGCGKLTDCYVGHDLPDEPFFCSRCNDEIMGWEPGLSALLALAQNDIFDVDADEERLG